MRVRFSQNTTRLRPPVEIAGKFAAGAECGNIDSGRLPPLLPPTKKLTAFTLAAWTRQFSVGLLARHTGYSPCKCTT